MIPPRYSYIAVTYSSFRCVRPDPSSSSRTNYVFLMDSFNVIMTMLFPSTFRSRLFCAYIILYPFFFHGFPLAQLSLCTSLWSSLSSCFISVLPSVFFGVTCSAHAFVMFRNHGKCLHTQVTRDFIGRVISVVYVGKTAELLGCHSKDTTQHRSNTLYNSGRCATCTTSRSSSDFGGCKYFAMAGNSKC
jgi:hypothetical protein